MSGYYAADGSMNVTVVSGTTGTGLYARDGSINVVKSSGSANGAYHPCGALWVTVATSGGHPLRAPDGSLYVSESPYTNGGQRVTVVSGSLSSGVSLSNPTDTVASSTTATLTVDTTGTSGTLYSVVTTSSTAPTKTQIKTGKDSAGATAAYAGSQSISSAGTKTFNATGLAAQTTYYTFFMHEISGGTQSNVSSADGLVTNYAAETFTVGPATPIAGTGGIQGTTWIIARPFWRSGTLDQCQIRASASGNVKVKIFRRTGRDFVFQSEATVAVTSGLNTVNPNLSVQAGDVPALYSATNNTILFTSVSAPSGTEYYSGSGDITTTATVGVISPPANGARFEANFRVSTPEAAASRQVGSVLYLGPHTPAAGTVPNQDTTLACFEDVYIAANMRVETIEAHATAVGNVMIHVLQPTTNGRSLLRTFTLDLQSGYNVYVAGTHFPRDLIVPKNGALGFWALMPALSSDVFNPRNYRTLDAASSAGLYPSGSEMGVGAFSSGLSSQSAQIRFGMRKTAAIVPTSTVFDWTFSSAIHLDFDATGWSISGGVATNGSNTGLANSLIYRRGSYCSGNGVAKFKFTTAADNIAVFRAPYIITDNSGSIFHLLKDVGGNIKISRRANFDGINMPAEVTSKVTTVPFATGTQFTTTLSKSGTNVTLTITDGTNTDFDSFQCHTGGSFNLASGSAIGKFGVCAVAGTLSLVQASFTGANASPQLIMFGDSGVDGSGASSDANSFTGRTLANLSIPNNGHPSAVSGSGSAGVLSRIENECWLWSPKNVFVLIGANDSNMAAWQTNYIESVARAQAAGANVFVATMFPRGDGNNNSQNTQNPYLRTNYAANLIDLGKALTTGRTGLNADVIVADFVDSPPLHTNDTGQLAAYNEIVSAQPTILN